LEGIKLSNKEILVIPRYLVTARFCDIPSLDESEIKHMAEFQAMKEIPYSKEEMVVSYRNLGSYKEGFTSLMLVIAKKSMIEEMIQNCKTKPEEILLYTELWFLVLLKKGVISNGSVSLIVHIGEEDSELMIVDKTRPIFSRGFKNSEKFFKEIDHSLLVYERDKKNPKITNIIVTHASNIDIEEVASRIKERFSAPVSFYEYDNELTDMNVNAEIDLLPKEISDENVRVKKKKEVFVTYALIGLIVALSIAYLSFKIHEKNVFLRELSARTDKTEAEIDRLKESRKKIDIAKKHNEQGKYIIEVLRHSHALIPSGISISGLNYDGKNNLFYRGNSKDTQAIFSFVKKLERSQYFNKVEVKHATKKKVKGEELTDFNIKCQINIKSDE